MLLTLRDIPKFPPPWGYACANTPGERRGRSRARQALLGLKLVFLRATADIPGEAGQAMQRRIHRASEPIELWLMHSAVLAALPEDDSRSQHHAAAIGYALVSVTPPGGSVAVNTGR